MSRSYTVKSGDTLLGIAIEQGMSFNQILSLNPKYQPNPNLIHVGDVIVLPQVPESEEDMSPIVTVAPAETQRPLSTSGCLEAPPQCQGVDIKDLLFQTDDKGQQYYCLDEKSLAALDKEVAEIEPVIAAYHEMSAQAPDPQHATLEALIEHKNKRKQWAIDAANAGVIAHEADTPHKDDIPQVPPPEENLKLVDSEITKLKKRRTFIYLYQPPLFTIEESVGVLKEQTLKSINKDLKYYEALKQAAKTASTQPQEPKTGKITLDNFANSKTLTTKPAKRHVVEFFSVKRNSFVYVRAEYLEAEKRYWHKRNITEKSISSLRNGRTDEFKSAILEDIKRDISKDIQSPSIEAVIKEWKADGGSAQEWKAAHYLLNQDGDTRFATSAEAQLLRWGAGVAIKSNIKPMDGNVDVGVSASAKIALAEASVQLNSYLPYEAGFPVSLSYTDANGNPQEHSFGRFRTNACITMSCFVGAMGSATAEVSNQGQEQVAGHSVLLAPSISMSESRGRIGVKAEGFAGAQVGGELTGGIEWQNPQHTTPKFDALATIKAEGNLAFGGGVGADFYIELVQGQLIFHCNARLVWGPGGSGGFGASVNFEHIWSLAQVVWDGVQYVDYRQLKNVNEEMYEFLVSASYMAFATNIITNPSGALMNAIKAGESALDKWYLDRQSRQHEAALLAKRILNQEVWSGVSPDKLLPETIGMMLDTLCETFVESFEKEQEKAICALLSACVMSWRKFEEVLARMNPQGEKQTTDDELFHNLNRINYILDRNQQRQFNRWVQTLAQKSDIHPAETSLELAFTPSTYRQIEDKLEDVRQQYASLKSLHNNNRDV
ncbi:LysM peptidoglycan-binding domain-containing protein [Vibrio diazotrophicus]|uniref:LysM peptidoglycan-binding domain-containing protein n=1 Tax=Vibrio diazotrophicus TaxID=685 RepID=UPI00142E0D01|nr:LysM domain-containing protein [Vibrio diazotrophicus]NIY94597.1 LysM peptidoglycan-binding domain-containing protein [Vibrio diazotrophicus]NVK03475.1 LysM peptidoglycan-binding domain-containing protein [Flavobacteriia bacterium]